MRKGNLFVISGPSGAGKGTLVRRIMDRVPDAWLSISATTREPRPGEQDGVSYLFVSQDEFERMIRDGGLLEWARVHDHSYGTPRSLVEEHMRAGDQVILEIDVQGAFQVREKLPQAHLIFIAPPSMDELRSRLVGRGTEDAADVELRMRDAEGEMARKDDYDVVFVNDDLETCTQDLVDYITGLADTENEE